MHSFPLPFSTPPRSPSRLLWHPRLDADPAHRWLRGCVQEACAEPRVAGARLSWPRGRSVSVPGVVVSRYVPTTGAAAARVTRPAKPASRARSIVSASAATCVRAIPSAARATACRRGAGAQAMGTATAIRVVMGPGPGVREPTRRRRVQRRQLRVVRCQRDLQLCRGPVRRVQLHVSWTGVRSTRDAGTPRSSSRRAAPTGPSPRPWTPTAGAVARTHSRTTPFRS